MNVCHLIRPAANKLIIIASLVTMPAAWARPATIPSSIKHKTVSLDATIGKTLPKGAAIEAVVIEAVEGVQQGAIKAINAELNKVTTRFANAARECHSYALGHPWEYKSKVEKILLTDTYISVVFARETVRAGTPDFAKDSFVFYKKDGKFIPSTKLFTQHFPGEGLPPQVASDKQLIGLNEDMVRRLIEDSPGVDDKFLEKCEHFLTSTSYKPWMEGRHMVLYPEFSQTRSSCQKEYVIKVGR